MHLEINARVHLEKYLNVFKERITFCVFIALRRSLSKRLWYDFK